MTWLGMLNYFVLQFFCIRLTRTYIQEDGWVYGYRIMYWVVPFTGWDSWNYKFIGKKYNYSKYVWKPKRK